MKRPIGVLVAVAALCLSALPVQAAEPALNPNGRILGVVPVHEAGKAGRGGGSVSPLTYHAGPTMNTNTTYAIFWGGSQPWDDGYQSLIERYFGDVAASNGATSNVYYSDTQYYDNVNGNIQAKSTFGGFYVDPNPYPSNGCTDRATSICLSDGQIQTEIQAAMAANGWSGGESHLFFMFTPKGVGSCAGSSCAYTNYCAYHSWIGSGSSAVLYANQPYANQNFRIYTCNSGQWPNGKSADATLNVVSHEHNEAITDQQGSAWYDSQGYENGDKCAWNFGTALGSTASGNYNQIINGNDYYLQQEWSNNSAKCVLNGL